MTSLPHNVWRSDDIISPHIRNGVIAAGSGRGRDRRGRQRSDVRQGSGPERSGAAVQQRPQVHRRQVLHPQREVGTYLLTVTAFGGNHTHVCLGGGMD